MVAPVLFFLVIPKTSAAQTRNTPIYLQIRNAKTAREHSSRAFDFTSLLLPCRHPTKALAGANPQSAAHSIRNTFKLVLRQHAELYALVFAAP